jgi:hypothetical protein
MLVLHNTLRIFVLLLLIGTSPYALPAQDLSGTWTGELVHDMHTRFTIEMDLASEGGHISGTSRKTIPLQQKYHVSMSVDGELRAGRIHLRETGITEQSGANYRWVMQSGPLKLDTNGGRWRLYGEWQAPGCEPGQLVLFKDKPVERIVTDPPLSKVLPQPVVLPLKVEGRKVHWAGTVKVREESVVLWLYDDLRYDGDTVSVFVNGTCVAQRIEVPHRRTPRSLTVKLVPGTNYLVLHAENEGSEAPNTAGLVVRARGKKHRLVLRSTMNHSGGLVIERAEER